MAHNNLPLCPCCSGKLYEECCYKKKGPDGQPLFFKGALHSNDAGRTWHPIPNSRLQAVLVGKAIDKYREYARQLLVQSTLPAGHHEDFVNLYAVFFRSYEKLLETLETPKGTGISFEIDTIEARQHWKDFLFHGRILLDFLGLHSRETLALKQDIGGLNARKFELLLATLRKLGAKDRMYLDIEAELVPLRGNVISFIAVRDKEKLPQETIVEFPIIDVEHGLVKDGKISLNESTLDMVQFINRSYQSISKLTLLLLSKGHRKT